MERIGFHSFMADYGETGVKHMKTLQQLRDAMPRINAHRLSDTGQMTPSLARA
ncbi:MAG: hypothetical protein RLZZ227_1998 [Pseudomonadota bacterium]